MRLRLNQRIPVDIQFVLKRWWALWYISKEKKTEKRKLKDSDVISNIKKILKPCSDNPKIIIDENVSSVIFANRLIVCKMDF